MPNEISGARRIIHIETDDLNNLNPGQIAFDGGGGELSYYNVNGYFGFKDNSGVINRFASFDEHGVFDKIITDGEPKIVTESGNGLVLSFNDTAIGGMSPNMKSTQIGHDAGTGATGTSNVCIGNGSGKSIDAGWSVVIGKDSGYNLGFDGTYGGDRSVTIGNNTGQESSPYRGVNIGIDSMTRSKSLYTTSIGHDNLYKTKSDGFIIEDGTNTGILAPSTVIGHRNYKVASDFLWDNIPDGYIDIGAYNTVIGCDNFTLRNYGRYANIPTDGKWGYNFSSVIGHDNTYTKGRSNTINEDQRYDMVIVGNLTPDYVYYTDGVMSRSVNIGYDRYGYETHIIVRDDFIRMHSISGTSVGCYVDLLGVSLGWSGSTSTDNVTIGSISVDADYTINAGYNNTDHKTTYAGDFISVGVKQVIVDNPGDIRNHMFIGGNLSIDYNNIASKMLVLGVGNTITSGDMISPNILYSYSRYVYIGTRNGYLLSGCGEHYDIFPKNTSMQYTPWDVGYSSHINNRVVLTPTTQPSSGESGDIYFDDTSNTLYCYDGSIWQQLWD